MKTKFIVVIILLFLPLFGQNTIPIFKTKLCDICVQEAQGPHYFTGFSTRTQGDTVILGVVDSSGSYDILRTRLKGTAIQDFSFAGDTLIGFGIVDSSDNWKYLKAILKSGDEGFILRTKLKDVAIQDSLVQAGYWIGEFSTSGPDVEGWVYLNAIATGIPGVEEELHEQEDSGNRLIFSLRKIAPNPCFQKTTISYSIAQLCRVNLNVYDITGRLVKTIISNHMQEPNMYRTVWFGDDNHDRKVSEGIYFIKLDAGNFHAVQKVLLLK